MNLKHMNIDDKARIILIGPLLWCMPVAGLFAAIMDQWGPGRDYGYFAGFYLALVGLCYLLIWRLTPAYLLYLTTDQWNHLVQLYQKKSHVWDRQDVAGTAEYEAIEEIEHEIRNIIAETFPDWGEDTPTEISQQDYGPEVPKIEAGLRQDLH